MSAVVVMYAIKESLKVVYSYLSRLFEEGKRLLREVTCRIMWGRFTDKLLVHTKDGLKFVLHFPEDKGLEYVYTLQSFETGTTNLLKDILRPDDIVFDIGANLGWYTILCSKIVPRGECHAFEPVPWIFDKLNSNCFMNNATENTFLNQVAVGSTGRIVRLHTFPGEPHTHSSVSPLAHGRRDFFVSEAQMITLNEYIKGKGIRVVNFIKCDVEGAEFEVLKGASDLFALEVPPMWLLEANEGTSKAFDYRPSDLFAFLKDFHDYRFYRVEGAWGNFMSMETIYDYQPGDNVLCIVPRFHQERLNKVI